MNKLVVSLIIGFIGVGGLLVFQATQGTASVIFTPSELAQSQEKELQRIRVVGMVADQPIDYQVEPKIRLAFTIQDPEGETGLVPVVSNRLKPDMFAVGRSVIIDGDFRDGTLHVSKIMTQCPSKYEPPSATKDSLDYQTKPSNG